jgi:hypothetical protein
VLDIAVQQVMVAGVVQRAGHRGNDLRDFVFGHSGGLRSARRREASVADHLKRGVAAAEEGTHDDRFQTY